MDLFPIRPNYIRTIIPTFETDIVKFQNGFEQRSPRYSQPKREFSLEIDKIKQSGSIQASYDSSLGIKGIMPGLTSNTEYYCVDNIINFYVAQQGAFRRFIFYNHIDETNYYVRFKEDALQIEYINQYFANMRIYLVECN